MSQFPQPPLFICSSSAVDSEVKKFTSAADHWWNESSPEFGGLHRMNEVRVPLIERAAELAGCHAASASGTSALEGAHILDVGCGGGILAEALGRKGASVRGADAGDGNIKAARAHVSLDSALSERVKYGCVLVEDLVPQIGSTDTSSMSEEAAAVLQGVPATGFDVVVTSETIEHVADPASFLRDCAAAMRPGGTLVVTTINRTALSYALAIIAAEHVLGILPAGTHEWKKFVTPHEVQVALDSIGLKAVHSTGFGYNPITGLWANQAHMGVNYGIVLQHSGVEGGVAAATPGTGAPEVSLA